MKADNPTVTSYHYENYTRISAAIEYIQAHFREQPNLHEVAAHAHLSPFQFQRLFTEWAGISPKRFLSYTTLEHARKLLRENQELSLFDTAAEAGLSGSSRLHDLFVTVQAMPPAEYKRGGKKLIISYGFYPSPFGPVMIASTHRGICSMNFEPDEARAVASLEHSFPHAQLQRLSHSWHQQAAAAFETTGRDGLDKIPLHVKGTNFQLNVWESLLRIPSASLSTYGALAAGMGQPGASRAVGTAIGSNPVAYLIPCHRVIRATGNIGGYRWGSTRKAAIIGWESARQAHDE